MTKKLLYRHFTFLMALLVLLSSMGVGMVEHECQVKGKSVSLVFKDGTKSCKLCRPTRKAARTNHDNPVFKKAHCCLEKQVVKAVEYQTTVPKKIIESEPYLASNPAIPVFSFIGQGVQAKIVYSLPPPPFYSSSLYFGRSLLAFVQHFLI